MRKDGHKLQRRDSPVFIMLSQRECRRIPCYFILSFSVMCNKTLLIKKQITKLISLGGSFVLGIERNEFPELKEDAHIYANLRP